MIKCPNGHLIPDDSKFCPDCGKEIISEEKLRQKATELATKYNKGYQYYVNNGTLPQLSHWLSIEAYMQIVSYRQQIISKQREIARTEIASQVEERRKSQQLEEERRLKAEEERKRELEIKNQENLKAKAEAGRIRLQFTRKDYSKVIKYFVCLVIDFGLSALYIYYTKDNESVGFDAALLVLPYLVLVLLFVYFIFKCWAAFDDGKYIIDNDGINEWKRQNPNNPALVNICSYEMSKL